jgi:hypothetical protein
LYCDENGNIFVADCNNHRVTVLTLWWMYCCCNRIGDWLIAKLIVRLDWYLICVFVLLIKYPLFPPITTNHIVFFWFVEFDQYVKTHTLIKFEETNSYILSMSNFGNITLLHDVMSKDVITTWDRTFIVSKACIGVIVSKHVCIWALVRASEWMPRKEFRV